MPPIRCSASFSAGISSSQGRIWRSPPAPTSLTVMRRSSTQARAALSFIVSASSSCSSSTSVPRSRIFSTKS